MKENIEKKQEEQVNFKEFISILWWITKLYYNLSPIYTVINIITNAVNQIYALVNAFLFGLIIDQIIKTVQSGDINSNNFIILLGIMLGVRISSDIVGWGEGFTRNVIRLKSDIQLKRMLYHKVKALGIQTLEDPEVTNNLDRANRYIYELFDLLQNTIRLSGKIVSVFAAGITVLTFFPIMIPVIIIISIPKVLVETYYLRKDWRVHLDNTEKNRKAYSNADYLTVPKNLAEVLVTNSDGYLDKKFQEYYYWLVDVKMKIYKPWYIGGFLLDVINTGIIFAGFYVVLKRFAEGFITLGDITFQFRALDIFYGGLTDVAMTYTNLRQNVVRYKETKKIFDMEPMFKDGEIKIERFENPPSIKFDGLSFKYPNTKKYVIKDLNLEIKAGEKVAIVGKNGAGKTTLVKLLSKFYIPTKGSIQINNEHTLKELNADSWYRNIGVLMQDYNTYGHLTVKENVVMGDPLKEFSDEEIKRAIDFADAKEFVEKYKNGYDQMLSERFKGGVRPSGGQWQKIALARFFYRNAPLLVFDEPTSAIDAESEYKIFNKIYEFFNNKTVIIISHRFSTVRNADRIIVLDEGRITEDGTHLELMEQDGQYAKMFRMQAIGYN